MPLAGIRCRLTAMLMADCKPNRIASPATAKRVNGSSFAQRVLQPAQHDEGEQRHQHEAEHDAELLRRDREDEVGMAVRQDALDRALARPEAEPAAAHEGFQSRCRSWNVSPDAGSRKRSMRSRDVRDGEVGADEPGDRDAAEPDDPDHRMPAMKNSAPQTSTISMVWPKSGCSTSSATTDAEQAERERVGRHVRRLRVDSANSQATG